MSRFIYFVLLVLPLASFSQLIYKENGYYGLKYEAGPKYLAIFDQVKLKEFFAYGRKDGKWYNLSLNSENSEIPYKRFHFHLIDQLLVVGERADGKLDLLDETGQFFYLKAVDLNRIKKLPKKSTYRFDDLVITVKNRKRGLFNWVNKKQLMPTQFKSVVVHEKPRSGDFVIYTQAKKLNQLWSSAGDLLVEFESSVVDDLYPDSICDGYYIKRGVHLGYMLPKADGRYFLVKPVYESITFPYRDPSMIFLKRGEQYGLIYKYKTYLKCKYDEIEIIDRGYKLARAQRKGKWFILHQNGELHKE